MQRRLREEGTSFKALLLEVRKKLAYKYLIEQRLSATDTAFLLGYHSNSQFFGAFKSWFGMTPNSSADYGLHWELPTNWQQADFDDSSWPNATTYSNQTIGVNNKAAYTNFIDIFDNEKADAEFIWSTNVVLDNELIVRYTVNGL